jgi:hypothetical protein
MDKKETRSLEQGSSKTKFIEESKAEMKPAYKRMYHWLKLHKTPANLLTGRQRRDIIKLNRIYSFVFIIWVNA